MEKVARAFAKQAGYDFHSKVGSGAFKETFLVSDASGPIALKVLGSKCTSARTDREIEASTRCSHKNIAKLRSVADFQFEGTVHRCLVEDYLAGGTLADRIKLRLFSSGEVNDLAKGLVSALEHLHSLELVHRDIKPDNIMYSHATSSVPVLVDFGLVRDLAATSITQTWFSQGPGTPLFAAPEQLNNRKELIDWRTDQFAVGVTLSFAGLGYHPHSIAGDTSFECVDRVAAWQEPNERFSLSIALLGLPIIAHMVRPYPVHRVRTTSKLAEILNTY